MQEESKELTVAEFLTAQFNSCGKSREELAKIMNHEHYIRLTLYTSGTAKFPIDKVKPMAQALGIDPVYFFRKVMNEYMPSVLKSIEDDFEITLLTENERVLIESYRTIAKGRDVTAVLKDIREIVALVMV